MASPGGGIVTESISLRGSGGRRGAVYTHTRVEQILDIPVYTELPSEYWKLGSPRGLANFYFSADLGMEVSGNWPDTKFIKI